MSRKKKFQGIAIALIVAGIIFILPSIKWHNTTSLLGLISLLLGSLGSIYSIFIPTSYTADFKKADWLTNNEGDIYMTFMARKHGQRQTPNVEIFISINGDFESVLIDSEHDKAGNVTVVKYGYTVYGRVPIS